MPWYQWITVEHWLQWITVENSISESRWNTGFSEPQRDTASVNLGGTLDSLNHSGTLYITTVIVVFFRHGTCIYDLVGVFTGCSFSGWFFSGTLTTLLKITSLLLYFYTLYNMLFAGVSPTFAVVHCDSGVKNQQHGRVILTETPC